MRGRCRLLRWPAPRATRHAPITFARAASAQTVLVVINASSQDSESCAPTTDGGACLRTTLPAGSVLKDIVPGGGSTTFTVKADGTVAVTVPAHSGRVLVRQ